VRPWAPVIGGVAVGLEPFACVACDAAFSATLRVGRWHRAKFRNNQGVKITGIGPEMVLFLLKVRNTMRRN